MNKYEVTIAVKGVDWEELIKASCEDGAIAVANDAFREKDYGDLRDIDWEITDVSYNRDHGEYNIGADFTGHVIVEVEAETSEHAARLAFAKAALMNYGDLEMFSMEWKNTHLLTAEKEILTNK